MNLPRDPAIHLVHEVRAATLATHSGQVPGYPYATAVPCVVDATHCPLFYVSALAEHTKNLLADQRASLSVIRSDCGSVQAAERLTLVGDVVRFEPSSDDLARYLRYQPSARQYLELDFLFFRLIPKRVRYIAGVGKMGWIEADAWPHLPALTPAEETALIQTLGANLAPGIRLLGIDCFGLDYEVQGRPLRQRFADVLAPETLGEAATRIVAGLR